MNVLLFASDLKVTTGQRNAHVKTYRFVFLNIDKLIYMLSLNFSCESMQLEMNRNRIVFVATATSAYFVGNDSVLESTIFNDALYG